MYVGRQGCRSAANDKEQYVFSSATKKQRATSIKYLYWSFRALPGSSMTKNAL